MPCSRLFAFRLMIIAQLSNVIQILLIVRFVMCDQRFYPCYDFNQLLAGLNASMTSELSYATMIKHMLLGSRLERAIPDMC